MLTAVGDVVGFRAAVDGFRADGTAPEVVGVVNTVLVPFPAA